ncbi:MAG: lipid A biosynthesis acyltransferase, partial [Phascolarctobacterium sp.]|nr:lipid A biosynthesis acyltransferase [Phascolarctobacterium sp.]
MLGYYIVKLFSKLMCVSPKWFRNLLAQILGSIACIATPKWRMEMAKANIMECLGVDEKRATV